jgi:hypothetical protein
MARKPLRIDIPKNPDDCIALAAKVLAKHLADGATSPLAGLGMADMAAKNTTAGAQNDQSKDLARQSQRCTENRDLALGSDTSKEGTVRFYLNSVRDTLLGKFRGNPSQLGDWGFDVLTTPKPAKAKKTPAA